MPANFLWHPVLLFEVKKSTGRRPIFSSVPCSFLTRKEHFRVKKEHGTPANFLRRSVLQILLVAFLGRISACSAPSLASLVAILVLAAMLYVVSLLSRNSACGEHP